MKTIYYLIIFVSIIFLSNHSISQESTQDTNKLFLIIKSDGTEFLGEIISDDGREILILTKSMGKIYIDKANLASVKNTNELKIKENNILKDFRSDGPFTTRYYFTNNALPVKKGDNYAMINLYGPEAHFAVNDKLSLGIMTSWIGSPMAFASKLSILSKDNVHLSIGNIFGSSMYLFNAKTLGGLHWATLSLGTRQKNISISCGYGYIQDNGNMFSSNLGEKYIYQTFNEYDPYYIAPYTRTTEQYTYSWGGTGQREKTRTNQSQSLEELLYSASNDYDWSTNRYYQKNKYQDALVIGIAGISPVGKKASFIFDGMVVVNNKNDITYSDYNINLNYDSTVYYYQNNSANTPSSEEVFSVNQNYTIAKGEVVKKAGLNTTIVFMPSMRFNISYEKAFQISLAGVISSTTDGLEFGTLQTSFPVPTVSWLRKF